MAEKKIISRKPKIAIKKPVKSSVRNAPQSKGEAAKPKKTVPIRVAAKKPLSKKTAVSEKIKSIAKQKKVTTQPRRAKKSAPQTKLKPSVKTPGASRKKDSQQPRRMTPEEARKIALRKALVQKREQIVKEVKSEISKYIKGETRQLVDTALDDGDWSVVDLSEDISFKHMSTHRENLLKIDEALRKLNEGTYGICEDCGEAISEQRLKILPFAIYCTDCQEKREQMEAMERREGLIG